MIRLLQRRRRVAPTSGPAPVAAPAAVTAPPVPPPPADLRWLTIDAADTAAHPGLVNDLIAKRIDGMMIRGVFTPDEIDRALASFAGLTDEWSPQAFGAMLGMPLNQVGANSQDRTPHLDDTDRCQPLYRAAFGFDPHQRVADVLSPMTGDLAVAAPVENGRAYNPGNIRRYEPGMGGLKSHAGNEFIGLVAEGAMSHLLTTTDPYDHMSYFVVLQPSEGGGSLSVFDLLWERHSDADADETWAGYRNDSWFDGIPALRLDPGPGDMILFGGGWRWHRVDPVTGPIPRITYGGFAAPSRDGRELHLFS